MKMSKILGGVLPMRDMIGYCGLNCEKCDAYLATIHNDQTLREKRQNCGQS